MRWKLRAYAAAFVLLCVVNAPASADADGDPMFVTGSDVVPLIRSAAVAHNVSPEWMVAVAYCESSLDPFAVSPDGSNLGLFQLNRRGLLPAFYARDYTDVWDPSQQANFAAEQFAAGNARAWSCA